VRRHIRRQERGTLGRRKGVVFGEARPYGPGVTASYRHTTPLRRKLNGGPTGKGGTPGKLIKGERQKSRDGAKRKVGGATAQTPPRTAHGTTARRKKGLPKKLLPQAGGCPAADESGLSHQTRDPCLGPETGK